MKKLVLVVIGGLLLHSCGSETGETAGTEGTGEVQSTGSGDVIEDKLIGLIEDAEKGMKPLSPIADVSKYDSNAKVYVVGEEETGNYNSKWENEDYHGSRFYSKLYNDATKLDQVRLSVLTNDDVLYDETTGEIDESKKIDFDHYLNVISEKIGSQPEKENYTGGGHLWKTADAHWKLSSYDDYTLEFTMKRVK